MAGFFSKLREGLTKTRDNIVSGIDSVFSGFSSIDEEFYEELEEILIMGDIGYPGYSGTAQKAGEGKPHQRADSLQGASH